MSRKKTLFALTAGLVAVLAVPLALGMNRHEAGSAGDPAGPRIGGEPVPVAVKAVAGESAAVPAQAVGFGLFPPLEARTEPFDRGFRLRFDPEQQAMSYRIASTSAVTAHLIARHESKEEGTGTTWTRYDAAVVDPATRAVRVYPLYEMKMLMTDESPLFEFVDENRVLFVLPRLTGSRLSYDLAALDVREGQVAVVASRFWETQVGPYGQEDFLLGAHYVKGTDDGHGKLILTSFKGRLWRIDAASGEVLSSGKTDYPAYGDPGSKPPRELVYPSPDLSRFVYQREAFANRFELFDTASGGKIGEFGFDEKTSLTDPGIVWSPDGRYFFLEHGRKDQAREVYTDNGVLLYAEGIRFYDRDGKVAANLKLPAAADRDTRMNAFGWADDGKVWIELFGASPREEGEPLKEDSVYKLYDIEKGTLADYSVVRDAGELTETVIYERHKGYSFRSRPYLLADSGSKKLWLPPQDSEAIRNGDRLFTLTRTEEGALLHEWNSSRGSWRMIDFDPVVERRDARLYETPNVVPGGRLVYERRMESSLDYVDPDKELPTNASGLTVLPAAFKEPGGPQEWWEDERNVRTVNGSSERAIGNSRYGKLKIRSMAGERSLKDSGGIRYYGTYAAEFTDRQGKKTKLPKLEGLPLYQEKSPSAIRVYEFDGYDILVFHPNDFRFSKGFDGGSRTILAFAATKQGEAYPLRFAYADASGADRSVAGLPIDANRRIERDGERLIVRAWFGEDGYELELKPDLAGRTLSVVRGIDRSAENGRLAALTSRYANRLEQALGLEDIGLPEGKWSEEQLRSMFTDKAWNNPGFRHLKRDFAESKRKGAPSRAFAWSPIDARFVSPDTIRFTFTLNLWYAIGLAAHLDVALKLVDGDWKVHDLGTLETEKLEGVEGYNGLIVRDPLEL